MTPKDVIAQVEKRFDDTFDYRPYGIFDGKNIKPQNYLPLTKENVKSFLSSHTKDLLQSVIEMAEGMKINKDSFNRNPDTHIRMKRGAYNKALSDIISKLK
jgi:hypothetical protein